MFVTKCLLVVCPLSFTAQSLSIFRGEFLAALHMNIQTYIVLAFRKFVVFRVLMAFIAD